MLAAGCIVESGTSDVVHVDVAHQLGVCFCVHQEVHAVQMTIARSYHQWGPAIITGDVHVCSSLSEHTAQRNVSRARRPKLSCISALTLLVDVPPRLDQRLDNFNLPRLRSVTQTRSLDELLPSSFSSFNRSPIFAPLLVRQALISVPISVVLP